MSISCRSLVGFAFLAASIAPAPADILASGPLAAAGGLFAVCTLYNHNNPPVTIERARILLLNGASARVTVNTCAGTLGPNQGCKITATAVGGADHICKVITGNSAANLRGTLQLYFGNNVIASDLR